MHKLGRISFGGKKIDVEIADNIFAQARGLMFRKSLPHDRGMLFVFASVRTIPITMFCMRFPLDIIWLDSNKKIVEIKKSARPSWSPIFSTTYPKVKAQYVLEVNAGIADELNLREGAPLVFS